MSLNFNDPFAHGSYLTWDGGLLKFDTCDEEDVEEPADIVEHPVEIGVAVTDHYRIKSRIVKLTAFISQEPVDPSLYPEAQGSVQSFELQLPTYPSPTLATQIATGIAGAGVPGLIAQAIAPSPPTTFVQTALGYASPIDTLAKVKGVIEDLRTNATPIDVATKSWFYSQHLISTYSTRRNEKTGTGTIIEITLQQVTFVATDAVAAPPTPKKPKDTPLKDKGKQNGSSTTFQSGAIGLLKLAGIL